MERDSDSDPVVDMTAPGSDTDRADGAAAQIPYADLLEPHVTDDVLDEGYSPPDYPPSVQVPTPAEERRGEPLARRLAEEVPDPGADPDGDASDWPDTGGPAAGGGDEWAGRTRSGRLIPGDESDRDNLIGADAGIAGGAASAEEAAVHMVEDDTDAS